MNSPAFVHLRWRPFQFSLPREMVTAHGALASRCGWLLRLETGDGAVGWGEAAALEGSSEAFEARLADLGNRTTCQDLETALPGLPPPLAFALGAALAELDGLGSPASGGWLEAPVSAWLLPAGEACLPALEQALASSPRPATKGAAAMLPFTVKWKVAAAADDLERHLVEALLELLPEGGRLRLDANGGWDRSTAWAWADRLRGDPRLEWLEQPLDPVDQEGLEALARHVPLALDESLRQRPDLRRTWAGWQVRRPALEGDPRPLLRQLAEGLPRLAVSTALETGIGRRLVAHLASLQQRGATPTAAGLAPGWRPGGELFSSEPQRVWEAAA